MKKISERSKIKKQNVVSKRLLSYLTDITNLWVRTDISAAEKYRIFFGFFLIKLKRGNVISFLGYSIHCNSRIDGIGILKEVFLNGDYVFKSDSQTPYIIDAGGNIGIATLFFKYYFPDSRITVFEPARDTFNILQKNVDSNRLKNVTVVHGALGKTEEVRDFYYNAQKPGGSTGITDVMMQKKHGIFALEKVPSIKLSHYITREIDLLKMDVEGSEGEILEDLENNGKLSYIKQMVFEYHAYETNKNNRLTDLLERLERNGFSIVIYDNENGAFGKKLEYLPSHFMIRAYKKVLKKI